ncbi:hypothetical protein [Klebsiella pneumoniae]|uniref:hypothetical protein n=1 Tax=Klebsiella pneumoniae TaxID=573 RepID=UPI00228A9B75|nr:hypothetical protein [Klebsiella pneumoniae]EKZ6796765.1 hypothetical protein [Klebsiella pneumoniae]MCQ9220635.1 hypothetical protein [Klebsiella pneumoniae]MDW5731350.1 hypothetical protein [Klebsiella pneumoniae]MDW5864035.1 hypothetical protein [Klebsiella pneumoniae]MDW5911962.1 hypothetical protein [Klebsiella pneumoniae]
MTDITKLAHGNSLRKKLNRRLNDAYGFQRTSGGKHTTISLSIAECKSVIAALDERLALVEALEKAQQRIGKLEKKLTDHKRMNQEMAKAMLTPNDSDAAGMEIAALRQRIAELESSTVTVKLPDEVDVLLNHLEDVLPFEVFQLIDANKWNAVSRLSAAGIKVEAE